MCTFCIAQISIPIPPGSTGQQHEEQLEPGEQLIAKTAAKLSFNLASSGKSSLLTKISRDLGEEKT